MSSGVDAIDILNGFAAWEQIELPTFTDIERHQFFRAYATFPTPDDVDEGANGPLLYPYTCHWVEESKWRQVGANWVTGVAPTGSAEDEQEHVIRCCLMFGTNGDRLDLLALRDAQWRNAYREAFLRRLHVGLTALNIAHGISATMGTTTPISFDLFDADNVGIQTPITVCIRRGLPTGTG